MLHPRNSLAAFALAAIMSGVAFCADAIFINGFEGEPAGLSGITAAHNAARAGVGVAPLFWDGRLAATAQAWANACVDADHDGLIDHNGNRGNGFPWLVGENIYGSSGTPSAAAVVNAWTSESVHYHHDTNTCDSGQICGHYTQVVWSNSLLIGCGISSCPGLAYGHSVVCDYGPAGNIIGQSPY